MFWKYPLSEENSHAVSTALLTFVLDFLFFSAVHFLVIQPELLTALFSLSAPAIIFLSISQENEAIRPKYFQLLDMKWTSLSESTRVTFSFFIQSRWNWLSES